MSGAPHLRARARALAAGICAVRDIARSTGQTDAADAMHAVATLLGAVGVDVAAVQLPAIESIEAAIADYRAAPVDIATVVLDLVGEARTSIAAEVARDTRSLDDQERRRATRWAGIGVSVGWPGPLNECPYTPLARWAAEDDLDAAEAVAEDLVGQRSPHTMIDIMRALGREAIAYSPDAGEAAPHAPTPTAVTAAIEEELALAIESGDGDRRRAIAWIRDAWWRIDGAGAETLAEWTGRLISAQAAASHRDGVIGRLERTPRTSQI